MIRFVAAGLVLAAAFPALAADVTVEAPFARAAKIPNAGAAFMTIHNAAGAEDRLLAARAEVSKTVELHTVVKDGEMSRMVPVEAIPVPAKGKVELKPGSYHVMFMNLHAPLPEGGTIPLTLQFEKAGTVSVEVPIKAPAAVGSQAGHGHGHGQAADAGPADVTVYAAGPLARSLKELAAAFTAAGGGTVKIVGGHTPDQAQQIMQGAAADVLLGVDGPWIGELADKGKLQPQTVKPLVANSLVLVARKDSALAVAPGEALAEKLGDGKLAMADPAVAPAGKATEAALRKSGAWNGLDGKLVLRPNLKAVVDAVASSEAAAGVVLRTEALASDAVRVVADIPSAPMLTIAALGAGDNVKARAFYAFVTGAEAQAVFARHGFRVGAGL